MIVILHPLVDFCSVAVLASGGITLERWLAYNALAFALQLPLGVALDVFWGGGARAVFGRAGFAVGCALAAGGGLAAAFGLSGWVPLVATCVGNALFHLTAGANVLERSPGRSGPIGLFISTGAIGLMAGQMVSAVAVLVGVAVALGAGAALQTVRWRGGTVPLCGTGCGHAGRVTLPTEESRRGTASRIAPASLEGYGVRALPWVVVGLFALVVWRSWAGLLAGGMSSGAGMAFVLAGAAVTWAGKAAGGYASDRIGALSGFSSPSDAAGRRVYGGAVGRIYGGRGVVTAVSAVGSAALCFACSPSNVALWLVLLFVAQLATGPVLSLMYDFSGRRAGTTFGLNCLGLFTGSLV